MTELDPASTAAYYASIWGLSNPQMQKLEAEFCAYLAALPPPAAAEGLEPVAWEWAWADDPFYWNLQRAEPLSDKYIKRALVYASTPAARAAVLAPSGVWPDFIAPPQYYNPADGWKDPELPDFRLIWATALKLGWAVGLHGSMKRDCDLIATPWVENAAPPEALIEELCKALNAREVGEREAKPGSRVALNIQIDGWAKIIDLSIVGVPQVPLVTAVPTLTWPDGTTYQFSIEQGRRAIAAALKEKT